MKSVAPQDGDDAHEATVLSRLLATAPDHKRNVKSDVSPKKRGRPPKALQDNHRDQK
jgi:hypothetical protein